MDPTAAVQLLTLWSVYFFPAFKAQTAGRYKFRRCLGWENVLCVYDYSTAVIDPLSYTAPLGSAGTFHCAVTGSNYSIISWYVDRKHVDNPSVRSRGILSSPVTSINSTWIQSSLTVSATLENDGISINCIAPTFVNGNFMRGISENATFHVEGPPSPPVNLTFEVSGNQSLLTLRWNSLSGTTLNNDFIIRMYTVYVNIFQTGAETSYNTTMREYSMVNPCSDVKFRVTAWNDVGEGAATTYLIYRHNLTGKKIFHSKPISTIVFCK